MHSEKRKTHVIVVLRLICYETLGLRSAVLLSYVRRLCQKNAFVIVYVLGLRRQTGIGSMVE